MKYAIIENNKCTFIDEDRQRLVDTLLFLPEKTEADIVELDDDAVVQGYDNDWYLKGYEPEIPAEVAMAQAKSDRAEAVSRIVVEVDGIPFDGDETSQDRMARAVANARAEADIVNAQRKAEFEKLIAEAPDVDALEPDYDNYLDYVVNVWITADNKVHFNEITISQLARAGKLAGQIQSSLWFKPYKEVSDGATTDE